MPCSSPSSHQSSSCDISQVCSHSTASLCRGDFLPNISLQTVPCASECSAKISGAGLVVSGRIFSSPSRKLCYIFIKTTQMKSSSIHIVYKKLLSSSFLIDPLLYKDIKIKLKNRSIYFSVNRKELFTIPETKGVFLFSFHRLFITLLFLDAIKNACTKATF